METALLESHGGTLVLCHIQPGASRTELSGWHGAPPRLKIRIHAPPQEGQANEELRRFLAEILGVKFSAVEIKRGEKSRQKDVWVPLPLEEVLGRLANKRSGLSNPRDDL